MSRDKYHPRHAIEDPTEYYEKAFKNYPHPTIIKLVDFLIKKITKPSIIYPNNQDEHEYFASIDSQTPLMVTFSHDGKKNMHDPVAALGAVCGNRYLKARIPDTKTWAAVPYLTKPKFGAIIERLGAVPVIRSGDYKKYDVSPDDTVRDVLINRSVQHLQTPGNTLDIFPAGTKGGAKIREGAGLVLEQLQTAVVVPVALSSDTQSTGEIPKNLKIAFGEPVFTETNMTSDEYIKNIDYSLRQATAALQTSADR